MAVSNPAEAQMRITIDHGNLHFSFEGSLSGCLRTVNEFLSGYATVLGSGGQIKPKLHGLAELGIDGMPKFTADLSALGNKEKIALILYARSPISLTSAEIADIYSRNFNRVDSAWVSAYVSTTLKQYTHDELGSDMKSRYRLTENAKLWVEKEVLGRVTA